MLRPKIENLHFGDVYAENEVLYLENYEDYFYNIGNCLEKIQSQKKFVVVGRKGTGKTLLAHVVCEKCRDNSVIAEVESLKDFVFHELVHFQGEDISSTKYVPIFEWMIYINLAKHIVKNTDDFDEEKVTTLREFLAFLGHISGELKPEKTIELTRKLEAKAEGKVKVFPFTFGVGAVGGNTIKEGPRSYLENLENLKSFVNSMLKEQTKSSIVFYDELDDKFIDDDEYKNALISFLGAVSRINNDLIKQRIKLKICAVIRRDIIDLLHAPNINRILEDNSVFLDWRAESVHETELLEMIAHKIRQSSPYYKRKDTDKVLSDVMASTIAGEGFRYYLIHRTLGRPRDLIRMLSLVIEDYGQSLDRFESYALTERLPSYSSYLKREISSELSGHVGAKDIDAMFELLQLHGRRSFTYNSINKLYERHKFPQRELSLNLDEIISNLFDVGAICNYAERRRDEGGNLYYWSYNQLDLKVKYNLPFEIHPGLWDALRIQKPKQRL
ncbi:hypothetical protein F7U78_03505 [Vibrio parahaemolyticus]|uniref:P-loop ATPase, Sll1717 family n=2 Tax=Vibrio parahaemolyticus TaxID=670 RepID=UPI00064992BC|nr:hypothetical protein [Vibrio parahaemolyticus]EGQ9190587.1 hypothetical protein [Vibrio parahaemolyticus]ELI1805164.1 hypothetical protein [Vibrio parahaemolyticus]OYR37117.1 hypothetical protein YB08_07390 [Vibrio parahaemolyticus]HCH3378308.1 hypothetical protein [Vibrio parahaemolyticus]